MNKKDIQVSKAISYALRHNPNEFGITLDSKGWVDMSILLAALHAAHVYTSCEQLMAFVAFAELIRGRFR